MLKHLYIKNFILIDELNLDFKSGFSAFTGETGAGKSIMLDAISILCAERAGASYISKGKEKAIIEGTFDLSQNKHALEIKDTGIGIRSEDIPKIFDRGYSGFNGRMNEKSSGLGLYLARKISERLNIQIEVESKLSKGSIFRLVFPTNLTKM